MEPESGSGQSGTGQGRNHSCIKGGALRGGRGCTHRLYPQADCYAASGGWVLSSTVACQGGNSLCSWKSGRTVRAALTSLGSRDSAISHEERGGWRAWSGVAAIGPYDIWEAPMSGTSQGPNGGTRWVLYDLGQVTPSSDPM